MENEGGAPRIAVEPTFAEGFTWAQSQEAHPAEQLRETRRGRTSKGLFGSVACKKPASRGAEHATYYNRAGFAEEKQQIKGDRLGGKGLGG